ncbi:MAG: glycoside hydrolase family 9 protein [Pirellulaceae bacterium]
MSRINVNHLSRGLILLAVVCGGVPAGAQTFTRDLRVDIAVNQVGFTPDAAKQCVLADADATSFEVIRTDTLAVVFTGPLVASGGDFGAALVGDFSEVRQEGTYYLKAGSSRSYPFRIAPDVYDDAIKMIARYFALQRCGPSTTGYLAPCHCDDAVRLDDGTRRDTTGGWHDASDLRKWVGATLHGMIGLGHVYARTESEPLRQQIREELQWGNRYFLNMQEPAGYVMSHVGGDALKHGDGNRWTDNVVGPEGGEAKTIAPLPGRSTSHLTVIGDKDDRVIKTDPLDRLGQYKFIIAQATVAHLVREDDPSYSTTCLEAAKRCYAWCRGSQWPEETTGNLGGALAAAVELYRATEQVDYQQDAIACAAALATLQIVEPIDPQQRIRGFYRQGADKSQPHRDIWEGNWPLLGLCNLTELCPDHPDVGQWREAIRLHAREYLAAMSARNNFGIVPFGFFVGNDPGGNRRIGSYWYRYFMRPGEGWWVGINANVASAGIGLLRAAEVLDEPALRVTAQRQLDWILGSNPFCASTVEGIGHNHPPRFVNTAEFFPPTPPLPGAVMNGLGGTADDHPFLGDGIYHVSEYWTPMVAYTVWLMAELQHSGRNENTVTGKVEIN